MVRIFLLNLVLIATAGGIFGCAKSERKERIWEETKISDLAPSDRGQTVQDQLLKTINFDIYVIEVPAENMAKLDGLWAQLFRQSIWYSSPRAFSANSFVAGVGEFLMWDNVRQSLTPAGGKHIEKVTFLIADGSHEDLVIRRLRNRETIFYNSEDGRLSAAEIGNGNLVLRIKAEKFAAIREMCKVEILPAFSSYRQFIFEKMGEDTRERDFLFRPAKISLSMSPGQFVLLGPSEYLDDGITLSSLLFSKPGKEPTVRLYAIVCAAVFD